MIDVHGWDTETVLDRLTIEGEEQFEEAESCGKGVIFVSAHMGSTEIAASLVRLRGYQVTSVIEGGYPGPLMDYLRASRRHLGVKLLPAAGAGINFIRALRRKEMVALVVDAGVTGGDGVPVTFFGRETIFPAGPARLARLSGAPIVFGLAVRLSRGRFRAFLEPPILSDRKADAEEDASNLTQQIASTFERYVRRYPSQWYVFRDIWAER
jgi:KDO2-lipid IV(A) lauroyltransferase